MPRVDKQESRSLFAAHDAEDDRPRRGRVPAGCREGRRWSSWPPSGARPPLPVKKSPSGERGPYALDMPAGQLSDVALYYPHVHPRDETWLKNAVLFWPMIERIVPGNYLLSDTETGRVLQENGILTERDPGRAADVVGNSFLRFVESNADDLRQRYPLSAAEALEPQPGWNDDYLDLRFGWVHRGKIAEPVVEALSSADLAMRSVDGVWIGMHPALSDVYMCALAGEMAAQGRNSPITDEVLHHVAATGWTFDDLARALLSGRVEDAS